MELSRLRNVYRHDGPFATVYLEGQGPDEKALHEIRLRWRALREQLENQAAAAETLEALEADLRDNAAGAEEANGRVLVAAGADVLLHAPWDAALGAGDAAHWSAQPELGPYVREAARSVRELVVVADQQSAQVRQEVVAEQHTPREVGSEHVVGSQQGVHKPRRGWLSHKQIQRRADEAAGHNAKDIVERVREAAAAFRPEVLVLAGTVEARTTIREVLPEDLATIAVETDRGGGGSDETLTQELLRIATEHSASSAEHYADRLREGQSHDHAVQGRRAVMEAAERGAVDTLLFEHDRSASDEAEVLRACVETDSSFGLLPEGSEVTDGVAALLRFPVR